LVLWAGFVAQLWTARGLLNSFVNAAPCGG
jgi:hypothetical protein